MRKQMQSVHDRLKNYLGSLVAPFEDGVFLRVPNAIQLGHRFMHDGKYYRVDWCQPGKGCWVVMLTEVDEI